MAVTAYFGVMGSGKSYEVVSGPLLDAVAAGRRVVTNIDGISEERIHAHLVKKRGLGVDGLGKVVYVRTDDIKQPRFFPVELEHSDGAKVEPGFVQPGDLLVVDEAWKIWPDRGALPGEHMAFFRMHRHFVHEHTGVACDVVLMIQAVSGLNRSIRDVIELSFRMVKLKSIGVSKGYRVEMYETARLTKANRVGTFVRKYKSEIFPLYKSYAASGGGSGKEAVVDKRQNLFARPLFWVLAVVVLVVGGSAIFFVVRFFHGGMLKHGAHAASDSGGHASGAGAASGAAPASGAAAAVPRAPGMSEQWRVVGSFAANGQYWVVVADESGRLRVQSPAGFVGSGIERAGEVDGKRVAVWSGSLPGRGAAAMGVPGVLK